MEVIVRRNYPLAQHDLEAFMPLPVDNFEGTENDSLRDSSRLLRTFSGLGQNPLDLRTDNDLYMLLPRTKIEDSGV